LPGETGGPLEAYGPGKLDNLRHLYDCHSIGVTTSVDDVISRIRKERETLSAAVFTLVQLARQLHVSSIQPIATFVGINTDQMP